MKSKLLIGTVLVIPLFLISGCVIGIRENCTINYGNSGLVLMGLKYDKLIINGETIGVNCCCTDNKYGMCDCNKDIYVSCKNCSVKVVMDMNKTMYINTSMLENLTLTRWINLTLKSPPFFSKPDSTGCTRYLMNVTYTERNICHNDSNTWIFNKTYCIVKDYHYIKTNECVKHTTPVKGDCGDSIKDNECYFRYL